MALVPIRTHPLTPIGPESIPHTVAGISHLRLRGNAARHFRRLRLRQTPATAFFNGEAWESLPYQPLPLHLFVGGAFDFRSFGGKTQMLAQHHEVEGFERVDACPATKRMSNRSPPLPATTPAVQEETLCVIDAQGGLPLRSWPHQPALEPDQSLLMLTVLPAGLRALKNHPFTVYVLICVLIKLCRFDTTNC